MRVKFVGVTVRDGEPQFAVDIEGLGKTGNGRKFFSVAAAELLKAQITNLSHPEFLARNMRAVATGLEKLATGDVPMDPALKTFDRRYGQSAEKRPVKKAALTAG